MGDPVLTATSQIICAHAAPVSIASSTARVRIGGDQALTQSDVFTPTGCLFIIAGASSPCTTVQYVTAAVRVRAEGRPVLLQSSTGMGIGTGPQGPVSHVAIQPRVRGG